MASRLARARGVTLAQLSPRSPGYRACIQRHSLPSLVASGGIAESQIRCLHGRQGKADGEPGRLSREKLGDLYASMREVGRRAHALPWNEFHSRHIGPRDSDIEEMLKTVGMGGNGLDDFISQVIPKDVFDAPKDRIVNHTLTETTLPKHFGEIASKNKQMVWMNGRGYYPVSTPPVIKRNLLENPGWYTSYTPYQPEISQGRLESLLNFQTMVSDLTGLPVANASLLDEGTAGAEAMTMSLNCLPSSRQKRQNKTYVVSDRVLSTTTRVLRGRAEGFGINVVTLDFSQPDAIQKLKDVGDDLVGAMVQYPDTIGDVQDFRKVADAVHELGAQLSAATDLSALTILTPPGEWGADIAFGNSQRFGVPLGAGGPHAAFFATRESNKRRLPGRLVGVSKDRLGRPALRLALQTREQHIRREKATSNVCTAQALLANIAAMYAVYHGPQQLKGMALENLRGARMVQQAAQHYGFNADASPLHPEKMALSDTVSLSHVSEKVMSDLIRAFLRRNISVSASRDMGQMTMAVPAHMSTSLFKHIVEGFQACALHNKEDHHMVTAERIWKEGHSLSHEQLCDSIPESVRRKSSYLTHPVFNSHHSETEMLRYLHHLQSKDLSQVHSMIPLGSCTMKLNGTSLLELIGYGGIANIHPFAHIQATEGYRDLIKELCSQLSCLTGMDSTSIQPNSGAQGEFAGLRAIWKYHEAQGSGKRDICLIPVSAHGTNPASAAMAGMRTVPVKCDPKTGNLDIQDLREKAAKHADELAAIMITYPSTYGVFEPAIRETCNIVHEHGGLVYMDGANMNAQIGLTSPGALGADVCHLNLHKTFCIPHGGGGPGVGPICVKSHLAPYLPDGKAGEWVTSARFGSASILPISWAYMKLMGDAGLVKATKVALLNANYLLARLKSHYDIVYTNEAGRCAHEFIIDARPFQKSAGIDVADIAKRLQDYGFHSPTMSFPIAGTLMIEPTESESKEELDRLADALIQIREEIREIEEGKQPREGNVLKMAPHPQLDLVRGDGEGKWERPYSREKAVYPLPYLLEKKFWPSVGRADDAYGDTNLFCTCPPLEDTTQQD